MHRVRAAFCLVLASAVLAGCTRESTVRLNSGRGGGIDAATLPVGVYLATDASSAEIYLTDLPPAALEPGGDLSGVRGRLTHVHMFLTPQPGSTPVESTAVNSTIRHVVIVDGAIGVYSGGGFFYPSGRPGRGDLDGAIRGAAMRLTARNPRFADPLGPSTMDATVRSRRDDASAQRLASRLSELVRGLTPVQAASATSDEGAR